MNRCWEIHESDFFQRKLRQFRKNNKGLDTLLFDNLDTYFNTLKAGLLPINIKAGFIHKEPNGVKAIDQKGPKKPGMGKPKEARLYIFPDPDTNILHLITIGDKNSQQADITDCRDFFKDLKNNKGG
jgi:hypothetical protein